MTENQRQLLHRIQERAKNERFKYLAIVEEVIDSVHNKRLSAGEKLPTWAKMRVF